MIRVDIDETRLGQLFPAFLLVDAAGSILSAGPALRRHMPELALAARLAEQFRIEAEDGTAPLAALADSGQLVQLVALQSGMRLSGSVIALDRGYLFAMRYVPSQFALGAENLQMSDFGPDVRWCQACCWSACRRPCWKNPAALPRNCPANASAALNFLNA